MNTASLLLFRPSRLPAPLPAEVHVPFLADASLSLVAQFLVENLPGGTLPPPKSGGNGPSVEPKAADPASSNARRVGVVRG